MRLSKIALDRFYVLDRPMDGCSIQTLIEGQNSHRSFDIGS